MSTILADKINSLTKLVEKSEKALEKIGNDDKVLKVAKPIFKLMNKGILKAQASLRSEAYKDSAAKLTEEEALAIVNLDARVSAFSQAIMAKFGISKL